MATYAQKHGWSTDSNIIPAYVKTINGKHVVLGAEDKRYVVDIDNQRCEGFLPYKLAHGLGTQQVLKWLDKNVK